MEDGPDGDGAGRSKAHALVDGDGAGVVGADVKIGFQPSLGVIADEAVHQAAGVTFANVVGMRTYGAQFAVFVNGEALASHCDELTVEADAVIRAHSVGARSKESREGEIGESDHVGRIGGSHAKNGRDVFTRLGPRRGWRIR